MNPSFTPTLARGALAGALGGLLFGFDTAVIAGTTSGLVRDFELGRAAPFAFFSAMMLVQLVTVLAVYPETRGVTLEELEKKLARRP